MKCPNCGFDSQLSIQFCGQCGERLGKMCAACDFVNPLDHRYCGKCGAQLIEETALGQQLQPSVSVSEETAKSAPVLSEPSGQPALGLMHLEGERRWATVILADVKGSTELLERIGTEAWVEIMNRVLQVLESEVYSFGGEVDQFRGDGLVAFFGTKSAHEDDPERAVMTALAMQTAFKAFAAEPGEQEGFNLQLRVGVNTGEVIVANIGDRRQHSEDTAMGEAIALAARMEEAAEPGTVLVSENTYRLVESQFEWQILGEITVKGIKKSVSIYRPLGARNEAAHLHSLQARGTTTPLVGRGAEFDILKNKIDNLHDGRGGIVMISGDIGMGKSSLVAHMRRHIVRDEALLAEDGDADKSQSAPRLLHSGLQSKKGLLQQPLTWLQGRCRSYNQSRPYSMWIDLLQNWLGMHERETQKETRDRLRRLAGELWGEKSTEYYPYLATFLSLPLEEAFTERVKHLDAEGLRHQFFLTLQSWVKLLTEQGPVVLVFEDVHWVDTSSLDFLEQCLPLCDQETLLCLILFRPDRASSVWEFRHLVETRYPHRVNHLILSPLNEVQGGEMIDRKIGPETLPEETRSLLLNRAEGNPYYIEVFLRSLIMKGVLIQEAPDGKWKITRAVDSLELPNTLQSLLLARMDRLAPEERRVLQIASVLGSVFWSNMLEALSRNGKVLGGGELQSHLTALQRSQMIYERVRTPDLGMEYAFESSLLRDATYESLLSEQRIAYHLKAANYLQDLSESESLSQNYSMLAYHYHQAGSFEQELIYTLLVASQAMDIYANAEALEYYTHALELLEELERRSEDQETLYAIRTQRFEVLTKRLEVFYLVGDIEAKLADALALLPLAKQLEDDPKWRIDAILQQPGVEWYKSKENAAEGVAMAEEALSLARQLGDRHREMRILGSMASQRFVLNDPAWKELVEKSLKLARELGDKRYEVGILTGYGSVYVVSEPDRSVEYLEAALQVSQALDDKRAELDILELISSQLENSDDHYRRLKDCHEKMLRLSREIGHRPMEAYSLMFYGQIQGLSLGDYKGGLSMLEENLQISEGMSTNYYTLLRIAQIQAMQGKYDEALGTIERARVIGKQHSQDIADAGLALVSAILYNALGDQAHLQMALDFATQKREVFVDTPELSQQYQMVVACEATAAHLGLANAVSKASERRSHIRQALERSQMAVDHYQSFGFVRPIECTSEEILYRHSLALGANDRQEEAADYLQRAYDEMMRKHDLIPPESPFRRTYIGNIPLHREILAAYTIGQSAVDEVPKM